MTIQRTALPTTPLESAPIPGAMITTAAARALAVLRVSAGFVFLWAFLDKTFGLHYSTSPGKAWIHGGSPTKGFLGHVGVGPLQSTFHSIAGTWWCNTIFMGGLLMIGVALVSGVAVRIATASGVLLLGLMWLAVFPFAQSTNAGTATGSTNPFMDDHLMYSIVLVVLAFTYAGSTWGLGRRWARVPFVTRHSWAL